MSYIEDEIKAVMMSVAKEARDRLTEPTRKWRHSVAFKINGPFRRGGDLVVQVTTEDGPYFWLDGGAKRHARMGRGFQRKTQPKSFKSDVGAPPFDPVKIYPKPVGDIEARGWTELASAEKQMVLQLAIDRTLAKYRIGKATTTAGRSASYTP